MSKLSNLAVAQLPPELVLSTQIDRTLDSVQQLTTFNAGNTAEVSTLNPSNIEIKINSNMWLNPSSSYFRFNATLRRTGGAGGAISANGAASFFKRIRIEVDGRSVETLDDYNTMARFLYYTGSEHNDKQSNWSQGYGQECLDVTSAPTEGTERLYLASGTNTVTREFTMNIASGLLSYNKLIPLMGFPEITIIFELANVGECYYSAVASTIPELVITNMKYVAELHQLPGSFNQQVMRSIENGGLEFSVPSWDTRTINLTAATASEEEIVSSVKSVKAIYFAQRKEIGKAVGASDAVGDINFTQDYLESFQLRIGSHYYPNTECHVGAQAFEELTKSRQRDLTPMFKTGYQITLNEYSKEVVGAGVLGKACYGLDLEKFLSSELISGTSFANQNILLKMSRTAGQTSGTKLFIFIYRDALLRIGRGFQVNYTT